MFPSELLPVTLTGMWTFPYFLSIFRDFVCCRRPREKLSAGLLSMSTATKSPTNRAAAQVAVPHGGRPHAPVAEILHSAQSGSVVTVAGRVIARRDFKAHAFLVIKDRSGELQLVMEKTGSLAAAPAPKIGSYIEAQGAVCPQERAPGGKELLLSAIIQLGSPHAELPLLLNTRPKETLEVQLDHRPLSLRNPWVETVFRVQHLVGKAYRAAMEELGFVEIHTSKLVAGGTEGGAQVFKLPYFDIEMTLAQSPQVFKQLAVAAFERVFEIGPVFRAENSNTRRHLTEFTSLDFEIAFIAGVHDVMDVEEYFVRRLFEVLQAEGADHLRRFKAVLPQVGVIPRITYTEADALIDKHATRSSDKTWDRCVGEAALEEWGAHFLFVTEYPADEKPFYLMPIKDRPGFTHSFDLLFNGLEMSSGGQRIHIWEELLANIKVKGLDPKNYPAYEEAFKYGMPPHGGGAIGLERLTQMVLGLSDVREAAMFPRDVRRTAP